MSLPAIAPPDIDEVVTTYLRAALDDSTVSVTTKDSGTSTGRRVMVRLDGGTQTSRLTYAARLGIRVFGGSELATNTLARTVWALLAASPGTGPIRAFHGLSLPASVADPAGEMRYLTCELIVRGALL